MLIKSAVTEQLQTGGTKSERENLISVNAFEEFGYLETRLPMYDEVSFVSEMSEDTLSSGKCWLLLPTDNDIVDTDMSSQSPDGAAVNIS